MILYEHQHDAHTLEINWKSREGTESLSLDKARAEGEEGNARSVFPLPATSTAISQGNTEDSPLWTSSLRGSTTAGP